MTIEHRILLVEDDRDFADLLCRRLLKCGYDVTMVQHPRQALEAASLREYEVAILDRNLPEIDGARLMHMLKGQARHMQVIFLSGRDDPEDKNLVLATGAFAYLTKPCRLSIIEDTIESAIDFRSQRFGEADRQQARLGRPAPLLG